MWRNTTSAPQDFSDWSLLRLSHYRDDLEKVSKNNRDRKIRDRVERIIRWRVKEYESAKLEFESLEERWVNHLNSTQQDKDYLDKFDKILTDKQLQGYYTLIPMSFSALNRLVRQDWDKSKIRWHIRNIERWLWKLNNIDRKLIKVPEWWDDVLREYPE